MMGDLASLAASRAATAVDEDVTLMAGMAKLCSWAYLKSCAIDHQCVLGESLRGVKLTFFTSSP